MKISFYNIGCKVNFAETAQLQEDFKKLDFDIVEFGEASDIVLINTCTVTHKADADSRKIIRRAIRQNPDAYIAVAGCFAQLSHEKIKEIDGVDLILGTSEKFNIPQLISDFQKQDKPKVFVSDNKEAEFYSASSSDSGSRTRAVLKLQDGCDYKCSYCAVSYARGKSRSMPFNQIEKHLRDIEKNNYSEVILTGINLGTYKASTDENLSDILRLIASLDTRLRVRISSLEPDLITDEIIDIVANSETICPHFHIPLQSGSDTILKKMRRRYDSKYFLNLIKKINNKIPFCGIGIDIIVGFPGETEEYFSETYQLLKNLDFSYLHVFSYSDRQIAESYSFSEKVDSKIKKERTHILRQLSDEKNRQFVSKQLGHTRLVIPEVYDEKINMWRGWSDNYLKTFFKASSNIGIKAHPVELKNTFNDGTKGILVNED